MKKIIDILQSEYSSEYYLNTFVLKYSIPKIFPKIVLSKAPSAFSVKEKNSILKKHKRWYVYYKYIDPDTKIMTQQTPVYFNINRKFKDFDSRLKHIKIIRNSVETLLKKGYSPYENEVAEKNIYSAKVALNFAINLKRESLKSTSFHDYNSRIKQFKNYLYKESLLDQAIQRISKKVVNTYLNKILKQSSARNRNNTRTILSAIFSVLEDNEFIDRNFIRNIKPLKTSPERNKTYSIQKVAEIYKYLEQHDPLLLLYIKFVSYNFLRPIEVCRLQVKDIDLQNKHIHIHAKNKVIKTKIIPTIIIKDLKQLNLHHYNSTDFILTPTGVAQWSTNEVNKRNFFTKRYKKVKQQMALSSDYTIYSFRHTFITKLYRELRLQYQKSEVFDRLMLITGHQTLQALKQYLRNIDAELPDDYSDYLK